jgi:hypothetical protein
MAVKGNSEQGKYSRSKGVAYERRIAQRLTDWVGSPVRRTPLSGAYGAEWKMAGDMMFQDQFPFYVELKNREGWRFEQLFTGAGPVVKWWWDTRREADLAGLRPLLIFTRNRVPSFVAFRDADLMAVTTQKVSWLRSWRMGPHMAEASWRIVTLDDFLSSVVAEDIERMTSSDGLADVRF